MADSNATMRLKANKTFLLLVKYHVFDIVGTSEDPNAGGHTFTNMFETQDPVMKLNLYIRLYRM
jgi:hypothetical protein